MKTSLSYLSILISSIALTACGSGNSNSDNNTPPTVTPTEEISLAPNATLPLQFIDAKTKTPLTQKVNIILKKEDEKFILKDSQTDKLNAEKYGSGILILTPEATQSASPTNPITFSVVLSADGYFTTSTDIIYTGGEPNIKTVSLVNKAEPPEGTTLTIQKDVKASGTGVLEKAIELTTTQGTTTSDFSLPAGTVLKDHTGAPLTGDLQVSMGYFSPNSEAIGDIFPGGIAPNSATVITPAGTTEQQQGYFITAGLIAVDIVDSTGRKAHLFSDNTEGSVTIETPKNIVNPETNQAVKAGDTIPIWSHDEVTGHWTQEGIGKYVENAKGNLEVSYQVKHLSYWNLDWWGTTCYSLPIRYSQAFNSPETLSLQLYINNIYQYTVANLKDSTTLTGFYNAPNNQNVELRLVDRNNRTVGSGSKRGNNCSTLTLNIIRNAIPVARIVPVQILLTAPSGFTREDVNLLMDEVASITPAQRAQVLAFTHPNGSTAPFILDEAAYKRLEEITQNKAQVQNIKSLMGAKIQVSGYFYGQDKDSNYYSGNLSKDAKINLTLPNRDITLEGEKTYSYSYRDWWTGQVISYDYIDQPSYLSGSLKNTSGKWEYFYLPLKKSAVIKQGDTKGTIIFEDVNAIKRVMNYIKRNK